MDMDKRFCVVMVCYNHLIEYTEVIKTCLKLADRIEVLIFDNSNLSNIILENKHFSNSHGIWYLGKNKNLGLSVAYNSAIDFIKEQLNVDWITIFDQDTKVTMEYFNALKESINADPIYLIHVPLVRSNNGIMSPLKFTKWSQNRFNIINESYSNIACINSGSTVNKVVYENVGAYNEKLFLDLVDYDFFRRFYKKFPDKKVKIFKYEIKQEFSGDSYSTFDSDYNRFKIFRLDFSVYCDNWEIPFFYKIYILIKRAIKLSWHYKNISFIKHVLIPCKQ